VEEVLKSTGGRALGNGVWVRRTARGCAWLVVGLGAVHLSTIVRATQDRNRFEVLLGWAAPPWSAVWLPTAIVVAALLHVALSVWWRRLSRMQSLPSGDDRAAARVTLRSTLGWCGTVALLATTLSGHLGVFGDYDRLCAVLSATQWGVPLPAVFVLLVCAGWFAHVGLGLDAWRRERVAVRDAQGVASQPDGGRPGGSATAEPLLLRSNWGAWGIATLSVLGFVFALVAVLRLATGSGSLW